MKKNQPETKNTLNKYLAECGLCSRRKASELIKSGIISVNNLVVINPAHRISADEVVRHNKKIVKPERKAYLLLNKPVGYITSKSDPEGRKTVMDLVKGVLNQYRLYPVGRLDWETTGLLLLTNDGELTQKLAHPRNEIAKVYHAILDHPLSENDLNKVRKGVFLQNVRIKADRAYFVKGKTKKHIGVQIHSGKNRIVRRIFKALGYNVIKLDRVGYGPLTKKGVAVGQWRFLTRREVELIRATKTNLETKPSQKQH
jgi:23S rRNA pseudouridine2605 synthase